MIESIFIFVIGAIVGSFLNVCIHRMPLGESIVWPRSHCPHCKKRIPGYETFDKQEDEMIKNIKEK